MKVTTMDSYPESLRKAVHHVRLEDWYFGKACLHDDDIWLTSYPRSGSHFARFILVSASHDAQVQRVGLVSGIVLNDVFEQ